MNSRLFLFGIVLFLLSCTDKQYKKLPFYEIKAKNGQVSYLLSSSDYLKKSDFNNVISAKVFEAFDTSESYIPLIDINASNLESISNVISLGGKTLKSTLNSQQIMTFNENGVTNKTLDSIKVKLPFFLIDLYTPRDTSFFNQSNFWLKKALSRNKEISGLLSMEDYYGLIGKAKKEINLSFISTQKPVVYKKQIIKNHNFKLKNLNNKFNTALYSSKDVLFEHQLAKSQFKRELITEGLNKIEKRLNTEVCFIVLDLEYFFGSNRIQEILLSKGYQLKRIH